jgi:glucose/mannose-6-phosphate isomerase
MLSFDNIRKYDPQGMMEAIRGFPGHIAQAIKIGSDVALPARAQRPRMVVVTGLGGSAIAGDLLRCLLADETTVPIIVNRSYEMPAFVDQSSLVIVSSYSGNTEETVAAYSEADRHRARILVVTSGGAIGAKARKKGHPVVALPKGFQPRAALAYLFFPMLIALGRLGIARANPRAIAETIRVVSDLGAEYSRIPSPSNWALELAEQLRGTIPVIYSSAHLEAVNLRWRGQISENAKQLAFGNVLPEMNHNEIVGWNGLPMVRDSLSVVFLRDRETHRRVAHRERFTQEMLRPLVKSVSVVESAGRSRLARIFSLVHTGDWVSLYLAFANGEDPTPVKAIEFLKEKLKTV